MEDFIEKLKSQMPSDLNEEEKTERGKKLLRDRNENLSRFMRAFFDARGQYAFSSCMSHIETYARTLTGHRIILAFLTGENISLPFRVDADTESPVDGAIREACRAYTEEEDAAKYRVMRSRIDRVDRILRGCAIDTTLYEDELRPVEDGILELLDLQLAITDD